MTHRIEQFVIRWLGVAALMLALAGMYVPVLMTFIYSFNASRIGTVWTGFSLGGYRPPRPARCRPWRGRWQRWGCVAGGRD